MGLLSDLQAVDKLLDSCLEKGAELMAMIDVMRAKITEIDAETTRIGTKIDELVAKLSAGGMSPEEEQSVLDQLTASAERLKQIGTDAPTV